MNPNKEEMIKDARTTEAMKNGYMGVDGVFGMIAKYVGQPMYQHGSRSYESTEFRDAFDLENAEEIPTMDEEQNSYQIGYQFDGLSRGVNMSITVHHHLREIICRYNGKVVYCEIAGDLEGYAPDPVWEEKVKKFGDFAKVIEKRERPILREKMIKESNKKRTEILEYYKNKWGL